MYTHEEEEEESTDEVEYDDDGDFRSSILFLFSSSSSSSTKHSFSFIHGTNILRILVLLSTDTTSSFSPCPSGRNAMQLEYLASSNGNGGKACVIQ